MLSPPAIYTTDLDLASIPGWMETYRLWQSSLSSPNTRRAYETAWSAFLNFCAKMPWEATPADVARWLDHLRTQDLSPATLQQRLAALSSFYAFSTRLGASSGNPVQSIPRPRRQLFQKSRYLTASEARALLRSIPRHTFQGKRDYALFLAYLATGRRNTEIRTLRWGDFDVSPLHQLSERSGSVWYRWQGKGSARRDQCPLALWNAILDYLSASARLKTIKPQDYIFTPLTDRAVRLPNVDQRTWTLNRPLSMREVGRLLKRYATRAGLDPSRITVHTLRHTAAMLRREAGDDLEQISTFLGHASLTTTQVYPHRLEGQSDSSWLKVSALLGLSDHNQNR